MISFIVDQSFFLIKVWICLFIIRLVEITFTSIAMNRLAEIAFLYMRNKTKNPELRKPTRQSVSSQKSSKNAPLKRNQKKSETELVQYNQSNESAAIKEIYRETVSMVSEMVLPMVENMIDKFVQMDDTTPKLENVQPNSNLICEGELRIEEVD